MQTGSNAIQPCKLYFGELGTGGWAGRQWGEREEKEKRKRETKVRQPEQVRKGVQGRSATTTTDSAMSSWLSLYAGIEIPARMGSGAKHGGKGKKKAPRVACVVLLYGPLPIHKALLCTCSSCHTCRPPRQPSLAGSCAGPCARAVWYFPVGCHGGFLKDRVSRSGSGDGTMAMLRQKTVCSGLLQKVTAEYYESPYFQPVIGLLLPLS